MAYPRAPQLQSDWLHCFAGPFCSMAREYNLNIPHSDELAASDALHAKLHLDSAVATEVSNALVPKQNKR